MLFEVEFAFLLEGPSLHKMSGSGVKGSMEMVVNYLIFIWLVWSAKGGEAILAMRL